MGVALYGCPFGGSGLIREALLYMHMCFDRLVIYLYDSSTKNVPVHVCVILGHLNIT